MFCSMPSNKNTGADHGQRFCTRTAHESNFAHENGPSALPLIEMLLATFVPQPNNLVVDPLLIPPHAAAAETLEVILRDTLALLDDARQLVEGEEGTGNGNAH